MKIHKLIGLFAAAIIGTTVASEPFSSAEYMTNRVNTSLSPYDISVCRSVQWFRNNETNQFNPTNALSGDKILVLVDVPMTNLVHEPTSTNILSEIIVGFITFSIPTNLTIPTNLRVNP